jgi:hypothetical protein
MQGLELGMQPAAPMTTDHGSPALDRREPGDARLLYDAVDDRAAVYLLGCDAQQ